MYHPYFRGKQFELITIRETASLLAERNFVLYPFADIAPDVIVPGHGRVVELLRGVTWEGLWLWRDDAGKRC